MDKIIWWLVGAIHAGEVAPPTTGAKDDVLSFVIAADQFSRNIGRGTAAAFAGDAVALEVARSAVDAGLDKHMSEAERLFLYLPFQHAESRVWSHTGLQLMSAMGSDGDIHRKHWDIVQRFGRYPYRNAALGRESTAEEEVWLATSPDTFGQ